MRRVLLPFAFLVALVAACGGGTGGGGASHDSAGGADAGASDALRMSRPDVFRDVSRDAGPEAGGPADAAPPDAAAPDAPGTDGGGDHDADTGGADVDSGPLLELEPGTLAFFSLPLGSLRYAVSGWDAIAGTCVSLIWDYSNTHHAPGAWCDGFGPQFPYVLVRPDLRGDCGDVATASDLVTLSASGCVDFARMTPSGVDLVDVEVRVAGPAFTGRIRAVNRDRRYPVPVSIGLKAAAGAGPVLVQVEDEWGLPGWLTLATADGSFLPFDRCDRKGCGDRAEPVCPDTGPRVRTLDPAAGEAAVWVTWDGRYRVDDETEECRLRVFADPGEYRATFCWGRSADAEGRVVAPTCETVGFRYPTERLEWEIE